MKQKGICKGVIKKVCKFSLGHAKVESTQGRENKVAKKAIYMIVKRIVTLNQNN